MPKNKGKGGKNRRRGKNENENQKRDIIYKEPGQEYAKVLRLLGNGRLKAYCFDGTERNCHIRGKLRKKVWIDTSDIILVGLRDYQPDKADVILKYSNDEARALKSSGEIPSTTRLEDNDDIEFGVADDDDIGVGDVSSEDEEEDDDDEEGEEDEDEEDEEGDEDADEDGGNSNVDGGHRRWVNRNPAKNYPHRRRR